VLENLDWLAFIDRYDRPGVLFYLDPPYWGSEDDYGKTLFSRDHFAAMADRLKHLKGSFILSLNAVEEVFETFSGFDFNEVNLTYSIMGGSGKSVKEVIITHSKLQVS
jgi:DNA adenine methylase